jgi:hypothetical protein
MQQQLTSEQDESAFTRTWRQDGPLGVLLGVISYIKTPQQHELFNDVQRLANGPMLSCLQYLIHTYPSSL